MFATMVALGVVATSPAMAQEHQRHAQPAPEASAAAAPTARGGSNAMPEMCKSMGMAMGMGMMESKMGGGKMGSKKGGMPMADPAKAHAPTAPDGKAMSTAQMKEMKMTCGEMMGKDGMMPMAGAMPKGKAMPKDAMPEHK
ncbi:hypothetical protein [uncultured Phenylobacterium sp.]|uniref:hypothetical protein n=1 Tax=uncultured Phenylobacterium sp. TaxID=349273 RepID=UPI0025D3D366|nr:hypothetical protein [uncultured Phenylobacterium sp.]